MCRSRRSLQSHGLLFVTAFTVTAGAPAHAQKMYWLEAPPPGETGLIHRGNLDGSAAVEFYSPEQGYSIAVDALHGKVYWTDIKKIVRADLDGSNVEEVVTYTDFIMIPTGLALDVVGGKMYWKWGGTLQRANLDGSNIEDLLLGPYYTIQAMVVDSASGHLYFPESQRDKIFRTELDGTGIVEIVNAPQAVGIALDASNQKLYWSEHGSYYTGRIRRCNLDGTDVEDILTGLYNPAGIALDAERGKVYWMAYDDWTVWRVNVDGTDAEPLVRRTPGNSQGGYLARHIALDLSFPPCGCSVDIVDPVGGPLQPDFADVTRVSNCYAGLVAPLDCIDADINCDGAINECDVALAVYQYTHGIGRDCHDHNGDYVPDRCEPMSRAVAVRPADVGAYTGDGTAQALRVTFRSLPQFATYEGQSWWVGPPVAVSEIASKSDGTPPTFLRADLQCTPYFRDWSTVDFVYVSGQAVCPGSEYDVQIVDQSCADLNDPACYSVADRLATSVWGDIVSPFGGIPGGESEPSFKDIAAVVAKFVGGAEPFTKSRADLDGNVPDRVVDFRDIAASVSAFVSDPYPFAGPQSCN